MWFILLCWDKTARLYRALSSFLLFLTFSVCLIRPREHHLLVSAGTRRTPCAVVVGPRLTTSRSLHVASADTLRSARESVCITYSVLIFSLCSKSWVVLLRKVCTQKKKQCLSWSVFVGILSAYRRFRGKDKLVYVCFVDNWSAKAKRRSTTGTGRLRHLKVVYRRFR